MEPTLENIRAMVAELMLNQEPTGVPIDKNLIRDGILDSYAFVELISNVEQRFGIQIGDDELVEANLGSVEKLTAFVRRKTEV